MFFTLARALSNDIFYRYSQYKRMMNKIDYSIDMSIYLYNIYTWFIYIYAISHISNTNDGIWWDHNYFTEV